MRTLEYRQRMSKLAKKKGYGKWMTGKKLSLKTRKQISAKLKGRPTWNKGKKHSLKTKRKISATLRKHPEKLRYWLGKTRLSKPHTEQTKQKISRAVKKYFKTHTNSFAGRHHTKETKEKLRQRTIQQLTSGKHKYKDTSIELKIEKELLHRGYKKDIDFIKNHPLLGLFNVDFYFPEHKIIIECDGDYWHNLDAMRERDKRKNNILTTNNFRLYRFWEHEINESPEKCIDRVEATK